MRSRLKPPCTPRTSNRTGLRVYRHRWDPVGGLDENPGVIGYGKPEHRPTHWRLLGH